MAGTPRSSSREVGKTPFDDKAVFQELVESAPDAFVVVDCEGRIALVNQQAEAVFGYKRSELCGEPVELLVPERHGTVHRQHRARYCSEPSTRPMGVAQDLLGRLKGWKRVSGRYPSQRVANQAWPSCDLRDP